MVDTDTYKGFRLTKNASDPNSMFWEITPPTTDPDKLGRWASEGRLKLAIDLDRT